MTLHMTCLFCMCRVIHHFLSIYCFPFDGDFDKAGAGRPPLCAGRRKGGTYAATAAIRPRRKPGGNRTAAGRPTCAVIFRLQAAKESRAAAARLPGGQPRQTSRLVAVAGNG